MTLLNMTRANRLTALEHANRRVNNLMNDARSCRPRADAVFRSCRAA